MKKFNNWNDEKRVGLYTTISFHLVVLILLLCLSIHAVLRSESTFVLDFTKQEELEKQERELELKEQVTKNLDQVLGRPTDIRNVAVEAGSKLKDDRSKNTEDVYDQAKALQKKMDASRRAAMAEQASEDAVDLNSSQQDDDRQQHQYSGPSVISWTLDGRKARLLPVPAYKGYGAGDVYVQIIVNKKGKVVSASVIEGSSSSDKSLHEFALEAARRSRFSASDTAPSSQKGEIVYRFIAQ